MAGKRRVSSTSPSCARCWMTFMLYQPSTPNGWGHERVWGPLSENRAGRGVRQITLMFQTSGRIPWECSFQVDPMRTSGMKILTPGPKPRLVSNKVSFFPPHLFIYPLIYCEYDLFSFCNWRKNTECTLGCFLSDTLSFEVTPLQATETSFA